MKTLMTATAIVALVTAAPALAQSDPAMSQPPAAAEPAPLPEAAPDMVVPEKISPDAKMAPDTGAAMETPKDTEHAAAPAEIFVPQQDPGDILASSLIGTTVENPAGDTLGNINDVVLSNGGTVDAVVIGVGGFLGIGEKNVGVNFDAIEETADESGNVVLVLNANTEDLEAAPQYITVAALRQQEMPAPVAAPPPASSVPTQ
jgi:sporulation protein YlmC with PRC-barrel domain